MKHSRGAWMLALMAVACGDDDADVVAATDTTGAVVTTGGPAATTAVDGTDDGTETGTLPDVGGTTGDTDEPGTTGDDDDTTGNPIIDTDPFVDCRAVDYLYVIDNSASMLPYQQTLLQAFPALAAVTQALIPASEEAHVMVVKTDEGWGGHCIDHCDQLNLCLDNLAFDCSLTSVGCDAALGAGVIHPYGILGRNEPCELAGDARYIEPEESDVLPAMTCIADLGVRLYDTPRTADALVAALSESMLGEGGCNEGFLRDDALLVITIVTDKDDTSSFGNPTAWYDAVVSAKNGREQDVVVIGLFAENLAQCDEDAQSPVRLGDFVNLFPTAMRLDICATSYQGALVDTVIPIGAACEAMTP
jgi:hypothetical protein